MSSTKKQFEQKILVLKKDVQKKFSMSRHFITSELHFLDEEYVILAHPFLLKDFLILSSSSSCEGHLLRMCSFTDKEWIFFQAFPHPKGQYLLFIFLLSLHLSILVLKWFFVFLQSWKSISFFWRLKKNVHLLLS